MKKKNSLFVTYTIIQSITSSEMCSLHLTHPSAHTHTHLEQRAASGAAPGGQLGVRCLAQGSHLSRGQFLPRSIRATTAPLYMMPYTVLDVSFLISWRLQEQFIICHDDIRANRWRCSWSKYFFVCRQTVSCRKMCWKVLHDSNSVIKVCCLYCTS